MAELVEPCGARWSIRRTCIDVPGRAYHFALTRGDSLATPDYIGFYAESIDDARAILRTK